MTIKGKSQRNGNDVNPENKSSHAKIDLSKNIIELLACDHGGYIEFNPPKLTSSLIKNMDFD